jgi:2-polyprenyl-3-methyl-5-hydroxy-6-metoxy-1,4-benzoquinol methylase
MQPEEHILKSWHTNAAPWIKAIEEQQIDSRRLVTNQAIIDTLAGYQPVSLLDLGCGEGWLCRSAAKAITTLKVIAGLDAIYDLVKKANTHHCGTFQLASYQDIIENKFTFHQTFDIISINFALFGNELVAQLLQKIKGWLSSNGKLVIQTLHPIVATGEMPYKDGWRNGSWAGFSNDFADPAPWYFRTMESWVALFHNCGYTIIELKEPLYPNTQKPASVIFVLEAGL